MKELTLVVMAAGMGSRFGGPKQIMPVGPNGEFIIDYSVYDAIKAGFSKVVFIIKKEHKDVFDNTITKNLRNKIKVSYAYQDLSFFVPNDATVPADRTKPWGTTHAILCAKDQIDGPFAIINADDFYGRDAYIKAAEFLKNSTDEKEGAVIAYPFDITSSKYGAVKRAVLDVKNDYIVNLTESKVEIDGDNAHCEPLNGQSAFFVPKNHPVSMNLFCFKEGFLDLLEKDFDEFIHQSEEVLTKGESLVPDTAKRYLASGDLKLKNVTTTGLWTGVTFKEDLPSLKQTISTFIDQKEYPKALWD
ncbi:MAG: NTP transferase domain-containing protein [Clostridia bacterium]|nr:NTP transferase domain-containing protein [Clostridia bacterium]